MKFAVTLLDVFGSGGVSLARYAGNSSARAAPNVLLIGSLSLLVLYLEDASLCNNQCICSSKVASSFLGL